MSETPEDPRSWQAPDGWHHSPQQAFDGPPTSPPQPDEPRKRTWIVVLVGVVTLAILTIAAFAGLAVFGVESIKQRAPTSTQLASTLPTQSTLPSDPAAPPITCEPAAPESVTLISDLLASPAGSLVEARSYTHGRYEVFVAQIVDTQNRGLAPAMWMIEGGTPYAASSAATSYSAGIEDLTYEVNIGFQTETGLELQPVADALDSHCPAD